MPTFVAVFEDGARRHTFEIDDEQDQVIAASETVVGRNKYLVGRRAVDETLGRERPIDVVAFGLGRCLAPTILWRQMEYMAG